MAEDDPEYSPVAYKGPDRGTPAPMCAFPGCKNPLPAPPPRGWHGTHCLEHARDAQRLSQNARQFLVREGLTRRQLGRQLVFGGGWLLVLGALLDAWTGTRTGRYAQAWERAHGIRASLVSGPDPSVRDRAAALQALVEPEKSKDADAYAIWLRCEEFLRDAGAEGRTLQALARLRRHSATVVRCYAANRGYTALAAGLIFEANLQRLTITLSDGTDYRTPMRLVKGAEEILGSLCGRVDQETVAFLRHQAGLWRFRLAAFYARTLNLVDAEKNLRELRARARDLSPTAMVETVREELGFASFVGDSPRVEECRSELANLTASLSLPPLARQSVLRPEVDSLLVGGKWEAALPKILEYIAIYQQHPTYYGYAKLQPCASALQVRGLGEFVPDLPRPYW
jgi:hypothetical protein